MVHASSKNITAKATITFKLKEKGRVAFNDDNICTETTYNYLKHHAS